MERKWPRYLQVDEKLKDTECTTRSRTGAALLVIDAQECVKYVCNDSDKVIGNINALISIFRANESPVIFVQYAYVQVSIFPLHERLDWRYGDLRIVKGERSAFSCGSLGVALERMDVKRLAVCGFYTDKCVKQTIIHGSLMGHDIVMVKDCCSAEVPEAHRRAVREIGQYRHVEIFALKDIVRGDPPLFNAGK